MKIKTIAVLCIPFILAACSGAPGDSDLKDAMKTQIDQLRANALTAPMADIAQKAVENVHIVGCKTADAGGYQCDIGDGSGAVKSIRMVKDQGKWAIVD
ncbi:hypothetical protein [Paraburkholderia sp. J12]|uniref:hypothetical protein n=1 Tax=Paraburkholderia sp. J12 TaxID=2805432 RepID=UPI002ABE3933|nr:hypothetical protein [Paraburkholderia sp. J12]